MTTKEQSIKESASWWQCDNLVNHYGTIGLLHTDYPQVFITIPDNEAYLVEFEDFVKSAELNYLNCLDTLSDEAIEELMRQAWNFLSLQEDEEERLAMER